MEIINYAKAAQTNKVRTSFFGYNVGDGTTDPNRDKNG